MANDVARIIYKMAKEDVENNDLKHLFKKKILKDRMFLREKLKCVIEKHINLYKQPDNCTKRLYESDINGAVVNSTKLTTTVNGDNDKDIMKNIYVYKDKYTNYYEVTNNDSKSLIRDAIIALDLTWSVDNNLITVCWGHWDKEDSFYYN